jgi:hypothetical protein
MESPSYWTKNGEEAEDEYFMDRQYQYVLVGDSDHHGFLSHHTDQCIDPLFKKRIENLRLQKAESRRQKAEGRRQIAPACPAYHRQMQAGIEKSKI